MLQIAIWGICIMLVVKAIELWQRLVLAQENENALSSGITVFGIVAALAGSIFLFSLAQGQAGALPSYSGYGNF